MDEATARAAITPAELEQVQSVLATVHSFLEAHDISEQYRKLDNRQRRSPLTSLVRNTLTLIELALAAVDEDDDVPEE